MQCICGYEHETEFVDKELKTTKGDEPFIRIEGSVFRIRNETSYFSNYDDVSLYACPKCGTIKMQYY